MLCVNTLRPKENGHNFLDDILKCIFLNEKVWISIKISLKFVPKGPISNIPALVQIMAWHRPCDKPLSETMLTSLLTHICVTRPQWVNIRYVRLMFDDIFLYLICEVEQTRSKLFVDIMFRVIWWCMLIKLHIPANTYTSVQTNTYAATRHIHYIYADRLTRGNCRYICLSFYILYNIYMCLSLFESEYTTMTQIKHIY